MDRYELSADDFKALDHALSRLIRQYHSPLGQKLRDEIKIKRNEKREKISELQEKIRELN